MFFCCSIHTLFLVFIVVHQSFITIQVQKGEREREKKREIDRQIES